MFGQRKREEAAARRRVLQQQVEAEGWTWNEAQPPPAFEISEAALRGQRRYEIWTIGIAEVIDGTTSDRTFRAGRLVGYEFGTTNSGIPHGDLRQTNAIWMSLPAALPEIRLADMTTTTTTVRDYGLRLPPLTPPRTPDGRWQIETFIPAFATDLLHPAFLAALATLPPLSAIVIRAGVILAYGTPTLDVSIIHTIARTLSALIDTVPATAWGRADPLVAGTGVFPEMMNDGPGLTLNARLIRPDWKGYGLAKEVPWQDAANARSHVVLTGRGAGVDVWDPVPDAKPGWYVSAAVGNLTMGSPMPHGIPTVASTLGGDGATESS